MSTDLEVCDRALALLGESQHAARTELEAESDSRVSHCLQLLPAAKAEFLGLMDWGFARDDATLTVAATPPIGWAYAHDLPADNHRIVKVYGSEEAAPTSEQWTWSKKFALGGGKIRTNYASVAVEYVSDADFSIWPPGSLTAIVRLLAHYLAVPITGKPELAAQMLQIYEQRDRPNAAYQDATQFASNENYDPAALPNQSALAQERARGLTAYSDDYL